MRHASIRSGCENKKYVNENKILAKVAQDILPEILENDDWSLRGGVSKTVAQTTENLVRVKHDLETTEAEMNQLIFFQAKQSLETAERYTTQIDIYSKKIKSLEDDQLRLQLIIRDALPTFEQKQAIDEFKKRFPKGSVGAFWTSPDHEINQWLFRILGKWRIAALNGEALGLTDQPRKHVPSKHV